MHPEIVAPVDVDAQLHLRLAQRREPLPVDEFRLQGLADRLIHRESFPDTERLRQKVNEWVHFCKNTRIH